MDSPQVVSADGFAGDVFDLFAVDIAFADELLAATVQPIALHFFGSILGLDVDGVIGSEQSFDGGAGGGGIGIGEGDVDDLASPLRVDHQLLHAIADAVV